MTTKYVQSQEFSLAGSGATTGATSITLKSFTAIDGTTLLTMTDFGSIGYATIEPGSGTQEEQISFTGVTQNANGTATLTGVKTVLFISPYTETSGTTKTHAGSTSLVISNTAGFYNRFPAKDNDETIDGQWTFTNTPITPPAVSDATTIVKGISYMSVAPASAASPTAVGTNDPRVPVAYAVDAAGSDTYAITPSPAITAYAAGQLFTFKAGTANTGAATLNVNGLGAKDIKKDTSTALATGDILLNQIVTVVYDGTNMQLVSAPRIFDAATQLTGVLPLANAPVRAFQQEFPLTSTIDLGNPEAGFGSNTDGSVIYIYLNNGSPLTRLQRDSSSGMYFETHDVTPASMSGTGDSVAIIVLGSYIYIFGNDATNIKCSRFLAADLTGEQVMTVPVVGCTAYVTAWTDGTYAYIVSHASNTTARKWSVSGTTFSAVSTATCSSSLVDENMCSFYDGTSAYIFKQAGGNPTAIYKLTNIDGSTMTTTNVIMSVTVSDLRTGGFAASIDSSRMYIGFAYTSWNETGAVVDTGTIIRLYPVSKP